MLLAVLSDEVEHAAAEAGLEVEDVIQPMSVWISYDCQSKREYLGVRFVTPRGEVDSAEILMDLSILPTQPYEWKHRSDQINEYYGLIQKEDHMVDALIEAMKHLNNLIRSN